MLIPLSDAAKAKGDVAAIGGAAAAFFSVIPWPGVAAFLSCVYLGLRIFGWVWDRCKGKKPSED